jgi:hypothetical protein
VKFGVFYLGSSPDKVMGTYHDEYRRDGGEWRFSRVELSVEAVTPFESGWVRERFLAPPDES